jgi:protein-tyrosine phosphatase
MTPAFDGLCNFREVGGLRRGVLYRSEELSRLSAADGERLRGLGIRVICDLRSDRERAKRPARLGADSGIRIVPVALQDDAAQRVIRNQLLGCLYGRAGGERYRGIVHEYYRQMAFERGERIGAVLRVLGREENLPAVIHCTAGKDRTGVVAALVQLLAGVGYGTVMDDYLRTNECMAGRFAKFAGVMRVMTGFRFSRAQLVVMASAQAEYLDVLHGGLVERYGGIEGYLREGCGVEAEVLAGLRGRMSLI